MRNIQARLLLLLVAAFSSAADAAGIPEPVGSQFQVNTYTPYYQFVPTVASDGAGSFVVVWDSGGYMRSSPVPFTIEGRLFDPGGLPAGDQFQVNTNTTPIHFAPALAFDDAGGFLVVWYSDDSDGSDTEGTSIQGRLFDPGGLPVGSQFQVNTYTTLSQSVPAVAFDDAGNFVVVWKSNGSSGSDTSSASVHGQLFDTGGLPVGSQFQVNTYTTSYQSDPAVASDGAGNFLVVWNSNGSSGSDTSGFSIQGRLFDAAGLPIGDEFQVNTYTTARQSRPAVAFTGAGRLVVVWHSDGSGGSDTSSASIQGRLIDTGGMPVGDDFQVNTYTPTRQESPDLASDGAGNFVVVWESRGSGGSDTWYDSIQGRFFGPGGVPVGDDFQVNTYTRSVQHDAAVAFTGASEFLVAWSSYGSDGSDTHGSSIQGQRFALPPAPVVEIPTLGVPGLLTLFVLLGLAGLLLLRARSRVD